MPQQGSACRVLKRYHVKELAFGKLLGFLHGVVGAAKDDGDVGGVLLGKGGELRGKGAAGWTPLSTKINGDERRPLMGSKQITARGIGCQWQVAAGGGEIERIAGGECCFQGGAGGGSGVALVSEF